MYERVRAFLAVGGQGLGTNGTRYLESIIIPASGRERDINKLIEISIWTMDIPTL